MSFDEPLPLESIAPPPPVRKPPRPHPNLGWGILWTLLFLLVSQGTAAIVAIGVLLVQLFFGSDANQLAAVMEDTQTFMSSREFARALWPGLLAGQLVSIGFSILVLRLVAGRDWTRQVALRLPSLPHLALTLLLLPALMLFAMTVDAVAKRYLPELMKLEGIMQVFSYWPWWLGVLIIGVGPGLGEELFCRAFLGRGLIGSYGVVVGILYTSVLFGLMHIEPRQAAYATAIGIFLHFVYVTTRSLWMPILLHFLNNSLSILMVSKDGPKWTFLNTLETAAYDQPALFAAASLFLFAAVARALYETRIKVVVDDPAVTPSWPVVPGVAHPPEGSGMTLVRPALSASSLGLLLLGGVAFTAVCALALMQAP